MATITLKYDGRNLIAKKAIDFILSLGVFEKKETLSPMQEAENDIKSGRVYVAKNGKDLIQKCLK